MYNTGLEWFSGLDTHSHIGLPPRAMPYPLLCHCKDHLAHNSRETDNSLTPPRPKPGSWRQPSTSRALRDRRVKIHGYHLLSWNNLHRGLAGTTHSCDTLTMTCQRHHVKPIGTWCVMSHVIFQKLFELYSSQDSFKHYNVDALKSGPATRNLLCIGPLPRVTLFSCQPRKDWSPCALHLFMWRRLFPSCCCCPLLRDANRNLFQL